MYNIQHTIYQRRALGMKKAKRSKSRAKSLTATESVRIKSRLRELEKRVKKLNADSLKLLMELRKIRTTH